MVTPFWKGPRKGFTLLELLVVLLLLALSSALIGPRLGKFLPKSPKDFSQRMRLLMEKTRKEAILTGKMRLVAIDPLARKIYPADENLKPQGEEVSIPKNVEIKAEGLLDLGTIWAVVFLPDGLSSGGEVEIIFHDTGKRYLLRLAMTQVYLDLHPL